MSEIQTISIDGQHYAVDAMSEAARNLINNLRATEQEIGRTQALLSMLGAARLTYAQALKQELDKMEPVSTH
jgi:hypothetical protein